MKNLIVLIFLLAGGVLFGQNGDKAVVCFNQQGGGTFCIEVSRVQILGVWQNACCHHMQNPHDGCIDDCSDNGGQVVLTHPTPPVGFSEVSSHFTMNNGVNDVWIIENNELSDDSYDELSSEYQYLNGIENFEFINEAEEDLQYLSIDIDENTYAIINKDNIGAETREKVQSFFMETTQTLKSKYSLQVYPSPVNQGQKVNLESPVEIKTLELINISSGKVIQVDTKIKKGLLYQFPIDSSIEKGIYYVKAELITGFILKSRLIIK